LGVRVHLLTRFDILEDDMPEIETERLLIRKFNADDLVDLCPIYGDPDVMRYISGHPLSREEIADWMRVWDEQWERFGFGWFGLELKETRELIGHCGLQFIHNSGDVEIAYGLAKRFWGSGLASEAARAGLRYGFEEVKLDRIWALSEPPNVASQNVMRKIGMRFEKVAYYKDPYYEGDVVYYSLRRADYKPCDSAYLLRMQ
jgi:RimJ/RimL family protein N-acetyltransferase